MKNKPLVFRDWVLFPISDTDTDDIGVDVYRVVLPLNLTITINEMTLKDAHEATAMVEARFNEEIHNNPFFRAWYNFQTDKVLYYGTMTAGFETEESNPDSKIIECNMFYTMNYQTSNYMSRMFGNKTQVLYDNTLIAFRSLVYPITLALYENASNQEFGKDASVYFSALISGFNIDTLNNLDDLSFEKELTVLYNVIETAWKGIHPCFEFYDAKHIVEFKWTFGIVDVSNGATRIEGTFNLDKINGIEIVELREKLLITREYDTDDDLDLGSLMSGIFSQLHRLYIIDDAKSSIYDIPEPTILKRPFLQKHQFDPCYLSLSNAVERSFGRDNQYMLSMVGEGSFDALTTLDNNSNLYPAKILYGEIKHITSLGRLEPTTKFDHIINIRVPRYIADYDIAAMMCDYAPDDWTHGENVSIDSLRYIVGYEYYNAGIKYKSVFFYITFETTMPVQEDAENDKEETSEDTTANLNLSCAIDDNELTIEQELHNHGFIKPMVEKLLTEIGNTMIHILPEDIDDSEVIFPDLHDNSDDSEEES